MQIVKFSWDKWEPNIFLFEKGRFKKIPLFYRNLDIKIGERLCTGYWKNNKYFPCPEKRQVKNEIKCYECQQNDEFFRCIKCSGNCINENQRENCIKSTYNVYLAVFDSLLKVGISVNFRLLQRLVEQGADFGVKLIELKDGLVVRRLEQNIKKELNITDRVNGFEKHKNLFSDPNISTKKIIDVYTKITQKFESYLTKPEIYDLRKYYKLNNVFSSPKLSTIGTGSEISGKIVAAKGNILILKNNGYIAINAHELIGRKIEFKHSPLRI